MEGAPYRSTGKRIESDNYFAAATTTYREMEMTFWLEQAEAVPIVAQTVAYLPRAVCPFVAGDESTRPLPLRP